MSRRRRALAVLGAAGILVGGYAVTSAGPSEPRQPDAGDDLAGGEWARDARVALASTNRQLETIAEVQAQWMELPEVQRAADRAGPAEALTERRDVLERRRAMLSSQLDTYESLDEVRAGLTETEQDLAEIERALVADPSAAPGTDASLTALSEQRDIVLLQRAARLQELAAMEGGIEEAAAQPLPDDAEQTTQVRDQVLDVIRAERSPAQKPRPDVPDAVLDDQDTKPAPEVEDGVLAAPGLDDEAPPAGAEQAADEVVDTVEEHARERKADPPADSPEAPVLADSHDADSHDADSHDADSQDADSQDDVAQEADPVETLIDTVEGVAESPGGRHRREEVPADGDGSAVPVDGPVGDAVDLVEDLVGGGVRTEVGRDERDGDGRSVESEPVESVIGTLGGLTGLVSDDDSPAGSDRAGSDRAGSDRPGSDRPGSDRAEADEPRGGNADDALSAYRGVQPETASVLGRSGSSRSADRVDRDDTDRDDPDRDDPDRVDVDRVDDLERNDADQDVALGRIIDVIEGMAAGEMGPLLEAAIDEALQGDGEPGDSTPRRLDPRSFDVVDDVDVVHEHDRGTALADPDWFDDVARDAVKQPSTEQEDRRLVSQVRGAQSPAPVLDASDLFNSYDDLELEALNEAGDRVSGDQGSGDSGVAETTAERGTDELSEPSSHDLVSKGSRSADERVGSEAEQQ